MRVNENFHIFHPYFRNHVTIMKEEWDRKLSFSMTTSDHNMETRTAMLAEVLLCLHQLGMVSYFETCKPRQLVICLLMFFFYAHEHR